MRVAPDGPLHALSILVVEDDSDTRDLLAVLLGQAGATVRTADGAETALGILEAGVRVDVVVSDISMPLRDGLWLIRELRARERWRLLPAIAVTAMVQPSDRRMLLATGYQAHVPKPVDFEALVATIQQVVADAPERADC